MRKIVFAGIVAMALHAQALGPGEAAAADYAELGRAIGYLPAKEFVDFLQQARLDAPMAAQGMFEGKSILLILLMVLGSGVLLNLTPCVLPMIPVNLAILAGVQGAQRPRRFLKGFTDGCVYGAGMALAYGTLGVVTLATGAAFGTWHSSAWFNGLIAVFFVALALAMLGVFYLDFSRFGRFAGGSVFGLGAVSALLAGACVAPIVVAVLVFSVKLYAAGEWAGALLPFLLGVGMALPWPFAAAGMRVLPKPGAWMVWVKRLFALALVGLAIHYGHNAYTAWTRPSAAQPSGQMGQIHEALAAGRPVVLNFGATWCWACVKMEEETLTDETVKAELQHFTYLKVDCSDSRAPEVRATLQQFDVKGFPTFVVIQK